MVPASFVVLLLFCQNTVMASHLYVAPHGSDSNPGTKVSPLQTVAAARDAARELAGKEAITIHVADGVYYLPETLVLEPQDSGTIDSPITYLSENEGGAILSGGVQLQLDWEPYRDGIYRARTPAGVPIDQLFINGTRQRMARYPNYDQSKVTAAYKGHSADAFSKERASHWADPTGGYIHAMHRNRWGGYHYRITGKKANGEVDYVGGWQNNRRMGMHDNMRMVENIFEELDAPGEWYHDGKSDWIYYLPEAGVDLSAAQVEVVRLRHLIECKGSEANPVRHVTFSGFVIRHAARTFMDTKEPLLRSDWAIYRGGAVTVTGGEDFSIVDTEFDQVGGNAIFFSNYNRRVRVKGCHIHDVGASGVCFVGDPKAVRNPLFEYRQKNDLTTIDRTPGPKTNNYPSQGVVEDCLIHGIGQVERQPAGVQISMAMEITVRDTSIYDCARAGINIGDGCWGGHLIERCDVFDTVLETHDHGSFNSWGRDRFWHSDRSVSQVAIDAEPTLPMLDAVKTTVIRDSRWRCDHGWDIDLDDGSTNYDIYNNLMLHGGLKFREGFRRRAWNNITVNNGFHPHVWYNQSRDEVFSNIFMAAHRGVRTPTATARGGRIDSNLFYSTDPQFKNRLAGYGWDLNSIVADPLFVAPLEGDFSVRESSPAHRIGFKNFPMDQFGVKKPALKAIARTPVVSELVTHAARSRRATATLPAAAGVSFWLGAKLQNLKGEEYSAYGASKEEGGVALAEVGTHSEASRCGFRENDLIQAINGRKTTSSTQLLRTLAKLSGSPLKVKLLRNQQVVLVEVTSGPSVQVEIADKLSQLPLRSNASAVSEAVVASQHTTNQPLAVLVDGRLAKDYGPVFPNGTDGGAYKMDLGARQGVEAIASWSFNMNGNRGSQRVTLYGSKSADDPGWEVANRRLFTPIGSLDTSGGAQAEFHAAKLAAQPGRLLGEYRWIVWRVDPITTSGENTAFQEFAVEIAD